MKPEVLLKAYVVHQSDDAFRELVAASLDEVYSTALRVVDGVSHLAEETALRVYWELARKAPSLGEEVAVASWLREHTCKTAVAVLHEEGRPADRLTLKSEMRAIGAPHSIEAAPRGLAMRVCQGVLLNAARHKGFRRFVWPTWIRSRHIRTAAVGALVILVLWKIPFHRSHRIIQSAGVQMTPAAFAQLASPEEGDAPALPSVTANTNTAIHSNQQ